MIDNGLIPSQVTQKTMELVFSASSLSKLHQGVTCLPSDCCFSEFKHYDNPTNPVGHVSCVTNPIRTLRFSEIKYALLVQLYTQ